MSDGYAPVSVYAHGTMFALGFGVHDGCVTLYLGPLLVELRWRAPREGR